MPLPNKIFSLTYPGTAIAGSRASTYVSLYSKTRWKNWELALKEAERQFGDENLNIQRQQALADDARQAILKQIQDLVDYQQALEQGAIDENYARDRFNATASQGAAEFTARLHQQADIANARNESAGGRSGFMTGSGSGSGSGQG